MGYKKEHLITVSNLTKLLKTNETNILQAICLRGIPVSTYEEHELYEYIKKIKGRNIPQKTFRLTEPMIHIYQGQSNSKEIGIYEEDYDTLKNIVEEQGWLNTLQDSDRNGSPKDLRDSSLSSEKEQSYLRIIGGMLDLLKDEGLTGPYKSNAQIIEALNEWLPGTPSYSKRSLETHFANARKAIDELE